MENNAFINKFTNIAVKVGGQVHLRSLRDAFAITMPMFILAGLAVLINNVVLAWFLKDAALEAAQYWGNVVVNGTLNISGLLIAPMIAYCLAKNKGFKNGISAALVAISSLIVIMPMTVTIATGETSTFDAGGILSFGNLGTQAMFAGIIVGLAVTELYMAFSKVKQFNINLGEGVPEAVGNSFAVMIPVILTISIVGLVALLLNNVFHTNMISLISTMIQEPLRKINTSLLGVVLIYSTGNLFFTFGIHQAVINGSILDPLLLVNTNENMIAYANGQDIPYILNSVFVPTFGMIGGTGSTISLIIATLLFGKMKAQKDIAKLGAAPGLFNINEPIIFGYPIVFNIPMAIPFVLLPALGIIFAYFMTAIGFMSRTVVMIPWTTPPLISAYLATAGDWRAVIVQLIIIVAGVALYLPFMRISEKVSSEMHVVETDGED